MYLIFPNEHCDKRGNVLESTCFRLALISALRSKSLGGKLVGMMVTASHNPEEVSVSSWPIKSLNVVCTG